MISFILNHQLWVIIFAAVVGLIGWLIWRQGWFRTVGNSSSVLFNIYMHGGKQQLLSTGKMDQYYYSIYTSGENTLFDINLEYQCPIHIVCLAANDKVELMEKEQMLEPSLQEVTLEGDFPSYFHVYCTAGSQLDLLQIFDPPCLAFLADFCKSFDIEIYESNVYFAAGANDRKSSSAGFMVSSALKLASTVSPLLKSWHGKSQKI